MSINTLIVDDEQLARERIRDLLKDETDIVLTADAVNGREAFERILAESVDLLFLDIQMPEMNGLELIETLPFDHVPCVIFVTAFDEYAVKAFELNAVDYLLKPFTKKRFLHSLDRARTILASDEKESRAIAVLNALQSLSQKKKYPDRLAVKHNANVRLIPTGDILWIESEANYLTIHTSAEKFTIRETMAAMLHRLDPEIFLRTHRSMTVNVRQVKEIKSWFNDELVLLLVNGAQVPVGRTYRKNVQQHFSI